jgi:TonB-dependent SusC/RagA subfamily outer membrane receptor
MTDRPATYITARRLASLSLGTLAIVAACGAELPTSAELEGMDVAAAERRAFVVAPSLTAAGYEVDGKRVTEKEAKALAAERIASIEIVKQDRTRSLVRIATLPKATAAAPSATSDSGAKQILAVVRDDGAKQILVAVRADGTGDSTRTVVLVADSIRPLPARRAFDGLVILDGVPTTEDVMRKLPPNQIERIEVIKGAAGEKLYGPQGARGVIVITTKK